MSIKPSTVGDEQDRYLVHPRSDLLDDRTRVLKYGDTFAIFDRRGDALPFSTSSHGLFHKGTRFLSRLELRVGGERPLLLGSTVRDDNALLTIDLANPELRVDGGCIPGDTIHIFRSRFVRDGVCYERVRLTNHGSKPLEVPVSVEIAADYADIFEVRGAVRAHRGKRLPAEIGSSTLTLGYEGLDEVTRRTRIHCEPAPQSLSESGLQYRFALRPDGEAALQLTIACVNDGPEASSEPPARELAYEAARNELDAARARGCELRTSNALFNDWINRSEADLQMMVSETEHGPYPYAGVPWFNTVFGRDGLITAREMLWLRPEISRGVLRCLAATQATETLDSEDAEPGKIIHEMRDGEMAALGEVPFGRYYGTVDATPLFVMLAYDYYIRTGDRQTVEELWPSIRRALEWIDAYGDSDDDGFVEYARHSVDGLLQQGWKDSSDSVFHDDGELAAAPIALCEVQGYVYAAFEAGGKLALALGQPTLSAHLGQRATELKEQFARKFWLEDLGTYALALDGAKRPCRVRSSNAGQCLFTGIAEPEHAAKVIETLMSESMFTGWGIRTLASTERRYNPMSYHNGSIWPHDNALIALGMARCGGKAHAVQVLDALFQASLYMDQHRMPELFCGFPKRQGEAPTLYPVACAPQAWAAAAVFMLLEACLGLQIEAESGQVSFVQPVMPTSVDWIDIRNLSVGEASIDLHLRRARSDVAIEVVDKRGRATVTVIKTV